MNNMNENYEISNDTYNNDERISKISKICAELFIENLNIKYGIKKTKKYNRYMLNCFSLGISSSVAFLLSKNLIIEFIAFFFIVLSYFLIYKTAKKMKEIPQINTDLVTLINIGLFQTNFAVILILYFLKP